MWLATEVPRAFLIRKFILNDITSTTLIRFVLDYKSDNEHILIIYNMCS